MYLSNSNTLESLSTDATSSSKVSLFPGRIQGDEEYDELRGGGDKCLDLQDRAGEQGFIETGGCMSVGEKPVIFVAFVVEGDSLLGIISSSFTRLERKRRFFLLEAESMEVVGAAEAFDLSFRGPERLL